MSHSDNWVNTITAERIEQEEAALKAIAVLLRGLDAAEFLASYYRSKYSLLREEMARDIRKWTAE